VRRLGSTVEWLGGLCLSALTLLIGFCSSGPTSGQTGKRATVSTSKTVLGFVAEVTLRDERNRDIPIEAECSEEMQDG
jgi:hypothetical protein